MNLLITGGAGFLGINLVRYLLQAGDFSIRILDIEEFEYPEKTNVESIVGDIRDRSTVSAAMKAIDIVIHCAAALPLYAKKDIYSTDVEGTKNLLEISRESGIDRFVHISTTAVYGVPKRHPIYEDDPVDGVGPYGKAKILAEELCCSFREQGLCVSILRPKSFVGPERLGVFALLYDWAREGRNFPMIGNGANRYQLLDVEDLCAAIHLCATGQRETVNDTYNIGAEEFATMKEDFSAVLDYAGLGGRIVSFPKWIVIPILKVLSFFRLSPLYRWIYDTASRDSYVSIEKSKNTLGFAPKYANRDALIRNYRWYLKNVEQFDGSSGISHRLPWRGGILSIIKRLF